MILCQKYISHIAILVGRCAFSFSLHAMIGGMNLWLRMAPVVASGPSGVPLHPCSPRLQPHHNTFSNGFTGNNSACGLFTINGSFTHACIRPTCVLQYAAASTNPRTRDPTTPDSPWTVVEGSHRRRQANKPVNLLGRPLTSQLLVRGRVFRLDGSQCRYREYIEMIHGSDKRPMIDPALEIYYVQRCTEFMRLGQASWTICNVFTNIGKPSIPGNKRLGSPILEERPAIKRSGLTAEYWKPI